MHVNWEFRIFLTVGLSMLLLNIIGCSVKVSDVKVRNIAEYKFSQTKNGISVAIEPILEERIAEELFGKDILSYGILPILVCIKNQNQQVILIERKNISLFNLKNENFNQLAAPTAKGYIDRERSDYDQVYGKTAAPVLVINPGASIGMAAYGGKLYFDSEVMLPNLSKKALLDRTVDYENLNYGFVYFFIQNRDGAKNIGKISIDIKNIVSDEISNFSFNLNQ